MSAKAENMVPSLEYPLNRVDVLKTAIYWWSYKTAASNEELNGNDTEGESSGF